MASTAASPLARFATLVGSPDDLLPLDQAVLLVAACDHPVDVGAQLVRLDRLAADCGGDSLDDVLAGLFGPDGFRGDRRDYHHPDNSFLDRVLDRRRGLPILLSVLTAEVAARAGVCLAYVAMPGHVLLRDCERPERFVDPFHGGPIVDASECRRLFAAINPALPWDDSYLEPVGSRTILRRVVANLVHSYSALGQHRELSQALQMQALASRECLN